MPSFIDIRFDLVSAENERTSAPELIERAFVDVDNITEHVLQSEKFIVYGPKGAGKTALAERLESLADESLFVKIDNLEDFDFRIFQTFAKPSSATVGGPVAVWKSLLALGLLSVLAADEAFTATNPAMAQLYARLNESRFSPQTTLKAIAEDSVRRGRTFFEWLSTPFLQPDVPPPSDPATAWDALRNSVTGATPFSGNRHLLILDGLDFRLRETAPADSLRYADYLRYVDELLTAVKAVNAEFASVGAKVMVLIRNEILFASSDSNIQKTVFDRGIEMWWYHHGKPEHSDLLKMLSMRAELAGYRISPEYVVRRWFDEPSIVASFSSTRCRRSGRIRHSRVKTSTMLCGCTRRCFCPHSTTQSRVCCPMQYANNSSMC